MSAIPSLFNDLNQVGNGGLPGLRGLLQATAPRREGVAQPNPERRAGAIVELSLRARQINAFMQRIRNIGDRLDDSPLSGQLEETGSILGERFARGAMVLQKTLEKFAELAEKFAADPESPLGRFLKIVQAFSKAAEDFFNGFLNRVEGIMQQGGAPEGEGVRSGADFSLSAFFAQVEFQLAQSPDGVSISGRVTMVSIDISMTGGDRQAEPLALDLNGNGEIDLTGLNQGALFDINGDGRTDRTSFVTEGDAVLALDANANGLIDSAHELFGDAGAFSDGFGALSAYDANRDGVIDSEDAVFNDLWLLLGTNPRGQMLKSLTDAGIASLNLSYRNANEVLATGDRISAVSDFLRTDGSHDLLADVWFTYA